MTLFALYFNTNNIYFKIYLICASFFFTEFLCFKICDRIAEIKNVKS